MGSTGSTSCVIQRLKDHPHIHGEHNKLLTFRLQLWWITPIYMGSTIRMNRLYSLFLGSPPYTWGAPSANDRDELALGITPIYMGSTKEDLESAKRNLGSPPYTWGAHNMPDSIERTLGITPIYMGSTVRCDYFPVWCKDHPHIHGEHASPGSYCGWLLGSPPYTWGALNNALWKIANLGITPIYMGSTGRQTFRPSYC